MPDKIVDPMALGSLWLSAIGARGARPGSKT
jgi:hypothetical protein